MRLPEFKLIAEPVDEEAKALTYNGWAAPEVGTRHKIGGEPDFVQPARWPTCRRCGQATSFYGQLDSLNDAAGRFDVAGCGMIFVFLCFDCNQAEAVVQSG